MFIKLTNKDNYPTYFICSLCIVVRFGDSARLIFPPELSFRSAREATRPSVCPLRCIIAAPSVGGGKSVEPALFDQAGRHPKRGWGSKTVRVRLGMHESPEASLRQKPSGHYPSYSPKP